MRVGVIGLGAVGPIHIQALKQCGQEIVALCDIEIEKCKRVNETFALNAKIYEDCQKMLDENDLEVVHICTPHYLHAEMICEGLRRNIHVLCEKPLAINEEQLDAIERAVLSSKAQLGVCFQNHFNASVRYLKEFLKGKRVVAGAFNIVWNRDAAYYAQGAWRGTWAQEGGGVMINQAIHGLDLMQTFCGMPDSVIAYTSNVALKKEIEVEDTAFALFKYKDGRTLTVQATNASAGSLPIYYMMKTEEEIIQLCEDNIVINDKHMTKSDGLPLFGKVEWGVGHVNLIANFYDCLKNNQTFSIGFYQARKVIKLILAMYRSNGEEVQIV
ncbi:MAG: Gfo/Idh/MocA family oxidoreductase [Clostridia bacterium]|nr:Gfo/Idh/MocA family oxidoreductase [Clostridia bacterium]